MSNNTSSYGQIVLAKTKKGFVPNAIAFITGSKFSHSLVTMPDCLGIPMCVEAAENGVSVLRFDTGYLQNPGVNIEIWDVLIDNTAKDAGLTVAFDKLEKSYGFLELPWFIWRKLNLIFGRDIKNQNNWSKNGTICSQLCRIYLTHAGLGNLFVGYGRGTVAPQDIYNIMNSNPSLFKKAYSNF